jgi:serine/threonine protein kinase
VLKIADLGFSKVIENGTTDTQIGTLKIMAPEIMQGENYDMEADMFR